MGKTYPAIDEALRAWLERQPVLFVGTAPLSAEGHVNVSPKGGADVFRVTGPRSAAYLDFVGSGTETAAHLAENGRIVLMFCAFDGPPKIVRLHGRGRVVKQGEPGWEEATAHFPMGPSRDDVARSVVLVDVDRISDSCGFGVPLMEFVGERDQLERWAGQRRKKDGDAWKAKYVGANNARSIDGLPGIAAE